MFHIFKLALFLQGERNQSKSLLRMSPSELCTQHSLCSASHLTRPCLISDFGCRDRDLQSPSCSSGIPAPFPITQLHSTAGGRECHKLVMCCDLNLQLTDLPGSSNPFMFNLIITAETAVVSKCLTRVHKGTCSF